MTKEDILNGLVDGKTYHFDVDNTSYWIYKNKYNMNRHIRQFRKEKNALHS